MEFFKRISPDFPIFIYDPYNDPDLPSNQNDDTRSKYQYIPKLFLLMNKEELIILDPI